MLSYEGTVSNLEDYHRWIIQFISCPHRMEQVHVIPVISTGFNARWARSWGNVLQLVGLLLLIHTTLIPGELKLEEMVVGITHRVTPRPSQLSVTSNMDSTCSVHQHSSNKGPITSEVVGDKNFKFICSFLCSYLFCFMHISVTSQNLRPSFWFFGNFDDIEVWHWAW